MSILSWCVAGGSLALAMLAAFSALRERHNKRDTAWYITVIGAVGGVVVALLATVDGVLAAQEAVRMQRTLDATQGHVVELEKTTARRDLDVRKIDASSSSIFISSEDRKKVKLEIVSIPEIEPIWVAEEFASTLKFEFANVAVSRRDEDFEDGVVIATAFVSRGDSMTDFEDGPLVSPTKEARMAASRLREMLTNAGLKVEQAGDEDLSADTLEIRIGRSERLKPIEEQEGAFLLY